jgi:methylphosphotriester-DNA--protein-cysteine methyltransferase
MRCPVCRADVGQATQCRRCRADLSLLVELEKQRQQVMAAAYRCLHQGRFLQALVLAEGADTLHHDEDTKRLRMLIYILRRDFAAAFRLYSSRAEFRPQASGEASAPW